MPPKKASAGVDKTFGMKNKKGSKAQQQIKVVQQQQSQVGKSKEVLAKEKKREEEKRAKELADKARKEDPTFNIVQPRVPFGVDPKTITCAYWKAGVCEKGAKCKYAHTNEANRKTEKKDLYVDMRLEDGEGGSGSGEGNGSLEDKKNDTIDKWDQAKLDSVIQSKHGNPKSTTDKVCKFFLQAVEDGKYGWFWECPNGGEKCMYKHRLPPGFVMKAQKKELEAAEKANEISLEEFLESARHQLGSNLTPVTPESFTAWKAHRLTKKAAEEEALESKKKSQAQANKMTGLSGRDLFTLNSDYFNDEDDSEGGEEFDIHTYMKGWEQGREDGSNKGGDDDDDDDVNETNGKLQDLEVES
ncbi:hypothetical protein CBS101457_003107 [Exobasidium rhododendri]|nr:hypothetical protein CBS101457_003107 [Exobasidium rhododendri]